MKRPSETPYLIFQAPFCSACGEDCEREDGLWSCPTCGSSWGLDDYGKAGEPWPDWSGEPYDGEELMGGEGNE